MALTARRAIEIAAFHGMDYRTNKDIIREEMEHARSWQASHGEDPVKPFDGYMRETARVMVQEARVYDNFQRNAY